MSFFTLRHLVEAVVLVVLGRHVQAAPGIFSWVKGERPSPLVQLVPLATVVILYETFTAPLVPTLVIPGLLAFVASLTLYEWTRRTVRGKFFSYALCKDTPQFLMTAGPYAYIRNPFYASYLLAYAGALILFPGVVMLVTFGVMFLLLVKIARHEERKFERSKLAADYDAYRRRTGMFIPRLASAEKA